MWRYRDVRCPGAANILGRGGVNAGCRMPAVTGALPLKILPTITYGSCLVGPNTWVPEKKDLVIYKLNRVELNATVYFIEIRRSEIKIGLKFKYNIFKFKYNNSTFNIIIKGKF